MKGLEAGEVKRNIKNLFHNTEMLIKHQSWDTKTMLIVQFYNPNFHHIIYFRNSIISTLHALIQLLLSVSFFFFPPSAGMDTASIHGVKSFIYHDLFSFLAQSILAITRRKDCFAPPRPRWSALSTSEHSVGSLHLFKLQKVSVGTVIKIKCIWTASQQEQNRFGIGENRLQGLQQYCSKGLWKM